MKRLARLVKWAFLGLAAAILLAGGFVLALALREDRLRIREPILSPYPDGLDFAFTVVDDTDLGTLENLRPVYDILNELGLRVTKTVWVFDADRDELAVFDNNGDTLQRKEYLEFVLDLARRGHEIALHTVAPGTDDRERTIAGYDRFRELFGTDPAINIMHFRDEEDLYWGATWDAPSDRHAFHDPGLDALWRRIRRPSPPGAASKRYTGHIPGSPLFWGDICRDRTRYARGPVTLDINTLRAFPEIPYRDPERPYIRFLFAGSMGEHGRTFPALISPENILRLERERGACIAYTHFGMWFFTSREGKWVLVPALEENLRFLASRKGWFVPATALLDRIRAARESFVATAGDRVLVANRSEIDLPGATLLVRPGAAYEDAAGRRIEANGRGELAIGDLARGAEIILHELDPPSARPVYWLDAPRAPWILDIERIARAACRRAMPVAAALAGFAAIAAFAARILRRRRRPRLVIPDRQE